MAGGCGIGIKELEQKVITSVSAASTHALDYVIPNGHILNLNEVGGVVPPSNVFSNIQVIWDPDGANEILFISYGESVQNTTRSLTGDGSKILRILLTNNDSVNARIMGGHLIAQEVGLGV